MCLVIDADCFGRVFDIKNRQHKQFAAVWNWVNDGRGRMIYGGSKYAAQLRAASKFMSFLVELQRKGKTVHLPDPEVDAVAVSLKERIPDPDFDDEHLAAIVIVSRCRVVCTKDKVAASFLKRTDVFAGHCGVDRPSIYSGHKTHARLCCDHHLVAICRE